MVVSRTQVGILGAGPAGLLLAHLLRASGIDAVVLETRPRAVIEATIRAGVLEQTTVDVLAGLGLDSRIRSAGAAHHGFELRFAGRGHRIDLHALTGGRAVTLYPQHELLKDLIAALPARGGDLLFEVHDTALSGLEGDEPAITFTTDDGRPDELRCEFIAGCDGGYGVSRRSIPEGSRREYTRIYPFGWFGILAKAPRSAEELIYANHERGFALISTRTATVQRMYLQCDPHDELANWPDERIWRELQARVAGAGPALLEGPIFQKGIIPMRSFVCEPMRFGRLLLAGDAAHIVPPTGAKGLNMAVADVVLMARALDAFFAGKGAALLDAYSDTALQRVWRIQHFSWWMTSMLHRFADANPFDQRRQLAELEQVVSSRAAATWLAENYAGLPLG